MSEAKLGSLIRSDALRDAVHVAILPVISTEMIPPASKLRLVDGSYTEVRKCLEHEKPHGIADPFLDCNAFPGDRLWMCLYPSTIIGMRHMWHHPRIPDETPAAPAGVPDEIRQMAEHMNITVAQMLKIADDYALTGDLHYNGSDECYNDVSWDGFWLAWQQYRGRALSVGGAPFRCSC